MAPRSIFLNLLIDYRSKHPTLVGWTTILLIFSLFYAMRLLKNNGVQESVPTISEKNVEKNVDFKNVEENVEGKLSDIDLKQLFISPETGEAPIFNPLPVFNPNHKFGSLKHDKADSIDQKQALKSYFADILVTPEIFCSNEETLLLAIFSRPENRGARSAIRKTWAKYDPLKYPSAKTKWISVFIIGRTGNEWLSEEIQQESKQYHDILMGDFIDGLFEDTRKFVLLLKWIKIAQMGGCQLQFVIKSVDNIFHNMISISGWLKAKYADRNNVQRLYVGKLLRKDVPNRNPDHPLFVPLKEYAGQYFPDLIQGPAYMFSYDSLVSMAQSMQFVTPIAMEDAYIGLLAKYCRLSPQHNDHFQMITHIRDGCHYLRMFFIYDVLPNDHNLLYKDIENAQQSGKCVNIHNEH